MSRGATRTGEGEGEGGGGEEEEGCRPPRSDVDVRNSRSVAASRSQRTWSRACCAGPFMRNVRASCCTHSTTADAVTARALSDVPSGGDSPSTACSHGGTHTHLVGHSTRGDDGRLGVRQTLVKRAGDTRVEEGRAHRRERGHQLLDERVDLGISGAVGPAQWSPHTQ